jgi:hypothetical protein
MTKDEVIRAIYGAEPPFIYDTSLPQPLLDHIAKESVLDWPDGPDKDEARRRAYETVRMGCVYAYDRKGPGVGLLPLTKNARLEIQISSYSNMIYVPVMEEL